MNDRRAHYVKPNHANRYPRRIVVIDTEARKVADGKRERHLYRLGAASFDRINSRTLECYDHRRYLSYSPEGLWEWITRQTRKREQVALFAHNLAYDIRLSRALEILPSLGWSLDDRYAIDGRHCWFRWKRGEAALTMRDLASFLPGSLETIAATLDTEKYPLPDDETGSDEAWEWRVVRDVEITRAAVLSVMHWLESEDMGSFRLTGAAQAEACYRHRFLKPKLLVHEDEPTLAIERDAAYTGRCEVWRHGLIQGLTEWDYRSAYARIARDCSLPALYRGRLYQPTMEAVERHLQEGHNILASVQITTSVPIAPYRDDRIYWPVGSFPAFLWDNELRLAIENGAEIELHEAIVYQSDPILHDWAVWILSELEGEPTIPPVIRLMVKAWSRSLIGRFALRYSAWEQIADEADERVEWTPYVDEDGSQTVHLHVGRSVFERAGLVESPSSVPALTSYITAEARCRLWRAMQAAGLENVVYVDTDSMIVTRTGSDRLRRATEAGLFEGLRVKARYAEADIVAPRGILLDGKPRVSGIPKNPRRVGGRAFDGETWEGLTSAIQAGRPGEVVVSHRPFTLKGTDRRRIHLEDGTTEPYRI